MKAAVLVVAWNGAAHIGRCLESLLEQTTTPDVVLVDNASGDDTVARALAWEARLDRRHAQLRLLRQTSNLGYTIGANVALEHVLAREEYPLAVLVNQDAWLAADCLEVLGRCLERLPEAGALGCRIAYPDGATLQHAGGYLTRPRLVGRHYGQGEPDRSDAFAAETDVEFVTGAVLALRTECVRRVGLFGEVFAPGYYEDVEWCERARSAGWRVVYVPEARAWHVESASFSDRDERLRLSERNRLLFALPRLLDGTFAHDFLSAEAEALPGEHLDAVRALGLASLDVLLDLDRFAHARLPSERHTRPALNDLRDRLEHLRTECLTELSARRRALLSPR